MVAHNNALQFSLQGKRRRGKGRGSEGTPHFYKQIATSGNKTHSETKAIRLFHSSMHANLASQTCISNNETFSC